MKSLRQRPTVLKEHSMKRPGLDTLACVNPECHLFRRPAEGNLVIRKVYGHDYIRLLHCRTCSKECSERRRSALYNTKRPEATAEDVMCHAQRRLHPGYLSAICTDAYEGYETAS